MKPLKPSSRRALPSIEPIVRSSRTDEKRVGIGRILVPIDFSDFSRAALDQAVKLCRHFDAELDLVHVYESTNPIAGLAGIPLVVPDSELERCVRRHLHDVARSHHLLLGKGNIHAIKGRPFEEVCRLSTEIGVDLIVISTHGYTGLKHLVLGSTAERIVRHAPCPVLVIRGNQPRRTRRTELPNDTASFRNIVVPIDFSDCSLKGLAFAKRMAAEFDSTLTLLHCLPPQSYVASEEYARYDLPLLMQQVERAATDQLSALKDEVARDGIKVESLFEIGHPGQQICRGAQDGNVDLIVTATHGHTGLKHVFLGSTAEYVVRHATCPVLVFPTREPSTNDLTEKRR